MGSEGGHKIKKVGGRLGEALGEGSAIRSS